mgnify:FL=1|tara:strand:- start:81 stop:458 length:378 start_codon:yes stop_codon:yes gene_type:complete
MNTLIKITFFVFFLKPWIVNAENIKYGIICNNVDKSVLLEFLFKNKKNNLFADTFKKINGQFIKIGKVVGQKSSSFILFEDKYAFLGVDFAWHLDKNTMKLKPVLLSEGTIRLEKMPEELSCSKI